MKSCFCWLIDQLFLPKYMTISPVSNSEDAMEFSTGGILGFRVRVSKSGVTIPEGRAGNDIDPNTIVVPMSDLDQDWFFDMVREGLAADLDELKDRSEDLKRRTSRNGARLRQLIDARREVVKGRDAPSTILLSYLLPHTLSEEIIANLNELFEVWIRRHGRARAVQIHRVQQVGSIVSHWGVYLRRAALWLAGLVGLSHLLNWIKG